MTASRTEGVVGLPGDKSISHRSLILAGMATGESKIGNLSRGVDVVATAACLRRIGISVRDEAGRVVVESPGRFAPPTSDLDARNSGTTMRLMSGVVAGQSFVSRLTGDASLSTRPMERVAEPLRRMGASVETHNGRAPLRIRGGGLRGVDYSSPLSSAQVKSAILLAGVYAEGETSVTEPERSRDHTERMLTALGVPVRVRGSTASLQGGRCPTRFEADLPGDPSSAAFLLAAAALTNGTVAVINLLLNPSRLGFATVLAAMGATVEIEVEHNVLGEPVGWLRVSGSVSNSASVAASEVPALIDELPLLALLGTQVSGVTSVEGAGELRVKETDRIATVVTALRAMGADIEGRPDGFDVRGPTQLRGAAVDSAGDHRLAMMLAVAGLVASGVTTVRGADAANVSFPGFAQELSRLGGTIDSV